MGRGGRDEEDEKGRGRGRRAKNEKGRGKEMRRLGKEQEKKNVVS
jgi:hypothetical protein